METKETLEEYLIRILRTSENEKYIKEYRYYFLEQAKKEYYDFLEKLKLKDERGGVVEELFVSLHEVGITPSKFLLKKMGYEYALSQLMDANMMAQINYKYLYKEYYESIIEDTPYDEISILLDDYKRIHDIRANMKNLDPFLLEIKNIFNEFYNYLYATINVLGEPHLLKKSFSQVVDDEIEFFKSKKIRYDNESKVESMYDGTNENPYKKFYVYNLGKFLGLFYILEIPEVTHNMFPDIEIICGYEEKDKYTLKDVAKVYALTYDLDENKVRENIKKLFQKIPFIQNYKNGNRYAFPDLLLPVMAYHIFRRHNIRADENNLAIDSNVRKFNNIYYPLFKAKVNGNTDYIDAYTKYRNFLVSEFKDAVERLDDAYLELCINELFVSSIGCLSLRVITDNDNSEVLEALETI